MASKIKVPPQEEKMPEKEGRETPLLDLSDAAVRELIRHHRDRAPVELTERGRYSRDEMNYGTGLDRKSLERLATSAKVTIVVERLLNENMRVTSGSWDNEKVILRDQVLEVRNVDARLHVARKPRRHDERDP